MRSCFNLVCGLGIAASLSAAGLPQGDVIVSIIRADPRTGKLVRMVIAPKRAPEPTPSCGVPATNCAAPVFQSAVEQAAIQHSVPAELIHSVIQVESNYNPYAVSPKGARGLMQLIPETARRFGVTDSFNPVENIQGGAKYLRYLLDLFDGNYTLALAAYNAGEAAVTRYGDVPPYPETRNYVQLVGKRLMAAKPVPPRAAVVNEATPAAAAPGGLNHIREIVEPDGSVRYVSQ